MTTTGNQLTVQLDLRMLEEPEEIDLRWRAQGMGVWFRPLASWGEMDRLLGMVGVDGPEYLIVESVSRHRFAQTMGDPNALIIEVCGNAGSGHPDVWRLRRAPGDRLPHAELGATLFEGGMDPDCLFTVAEAARVFRAWLGGGELCGYGVEGVVY